MDYQTLAAAAKAAAESRRMALQEQVRRVRENANAGETTFPSLSSISSPHQSPLMPNFTSPSSQNMMMPQPYVGGPYMMPYPFNPMVPNNGFSSPNRFMGK
jgi:hypothetical protein